MTRALLLILVASLLLVSRASLGGAAAAGISDFDDNREWPAGELRRSLRASLGRGPGTSDGNQEWPGNRDWPPGQGRRSLSELSQRLKRDLLTTSLGLPLELIRAMLEIIKAEEQKTQAEANQAIFDEVGK